MAVVKQRGAEFLRRDFNDVKPRRQRYAHDFKRAWVVVDGFGQIKCFYVGLTGQQ